MSYAILTCTIICAQVSKLTLEIKHQRLQLEGLAAQAEGERRKTKEKWEHKIKKIEKAYSEKMDSLVASLVQERSDSNLARLKTRLASREARIKQLEQEMEILRVDEEAVAVTKSLEEELRSQVELLTSELEESKKHHTPVRDIGSSLGYTCTKVLIFIMIFALL